MVYCTYNMLNMFRALLCPSSGARDYMCVVIACGVQCLVTGCRVSGAGQQAVSPGRGMLHDTGVQHPSSWTHSLALITGLLSRGQGPEGPATGHLDTGFSWFSCVHEQMLRWYPRYQVATTCFSCSPPPRPKFSSKSCIYVN